MSAQAALFPELSAAASSTSVVGLEVILPRACQCSETVATLGSSRGPHHASLVCTRCGVHRGWLSGETFRFLSDVIENFGRPIEPIEIRHNQSVPTARMRLRKRSP
jgi:hypothetical protein